MELVKLTKLARLAKFTLNNNWTSVLVNFNQSLMSI